MIPFAIDDLIISDGENWTSDLKDAHGLPQSPVILAERLGKWPLVGSITRPGRRLSLQTIWAPGSANSTSKKLLEQYVNPEREVKRRLMVSDAYLIGAAPSSVVLLSGPYDVQRAANGTYGPRDLIDQLAATVTGGIIWPAANQMQLAQATTNLITNPSLETNDTGWTWAANAQGAGYGRSSDYSCYGLYSAKAVCTGSGNRYITHQFTRGANDDVTVSVWVRSASGTANLTMAIYDSAYANNSSASSVAVTTAWTRLSISVADATMDGWTGGGTTLRLLINNNVDNGIAVTWYADCAQAEAKTYATPYCDGSLGQGHAWTGTAHASTSTRTVTTCYYANPLNATTGSIGMWWTPSTNQDGPTRYLFDEGYLEGYFDVADNKLKLTDGNFTASSDALTFSAEVAQHIVFTWSSTSLDIYRNGIRIANHRAHTVQALGANLYIGSTTGGATQCDGNLKEIFALNMCLSATQVAAIYANATANYRRCNVLGEEAKAWSISGEESQAGDISTLAVHGDVRWRKRDGLKFWRVIASGNSCVVNNPGHDDAYPVFYITPKTAKTSNGYAYKQFRIVEWNSANAGTDYPIDIADENLDAGSLIADGKLQADYDDLRVDVDGVEVDRWLSTVVLEDCEDVWNESVDADFAVSTVAGKIGNANRFTIAVTASAGDIVTEAIAASDISGFTSVFAWVRCSINTAAGNFKLLLDDTANCATPLETINIPALTANTWTRVELTLAAAASDTAIISVGIEYDADIGACTFDIDDIRTATKVWVNLDYIAEVTATAAEIATDSETTVTATTSIASFPSTGILQIESELITYTSKNDTSKTFSGCTRGAKGTVAAVHAAAVTIKWIQHDIWIRYGNAAATAPTVDGDYEPAFELDLSTNTSWSYEEFGEDDGLRSASWIFTNIFEATKYTANQGTNATPWSEIGLNVYSTAFKEGRWSLYNPCGITNVNFPTGEYKAYTGTGGGLLYVQSSLNGSTWTNEGTAVSETDDDTWRAWTKNEALDANSIYAAMYAKGASYVETSTAILTIGSNNPTITAVAEQSNYDLAVTIANTTTGDSIILSASIALNYAAKIDTDEKTCTYLLDNSNILSGLTLDDVRENWLRLQPGNNTLTFTDTGTVSIEAEIAFDERYFW